MALTQRFSAVDKAILIATGNSLVVCGSSTAPAVNTSDLVKTDGTTTRDWTQAGSSANLNILANSTILYAELVWYSTVYSNVSGALDLRSIQDDAITFTTSKGTYQITPQYAESYTGESGTIDRYRAKDVTGYIADSLSGTYTVSNVPISVPSTGLNNSRAGWSLVVIYRNNAFTPQKILYNSGVVAATPSTPLQTTLAGFTTSSDSSYLKGNIFFSAANGGPLNGIETVSVGPSFASLSNIGNVVNSPNPNPGTSPNNPGNSFFSGIINTANPLSANNGLLNINGTNGNNNHDGFVPIQNIGARNKWDITDINISNTLVPNQTLLAGQIIEGEHGDGIQLVTLGAQVSAKAPNIIAILESYDIDGDNEYNTEVGEALTYSIQIRNDGDVSASNVIVSAALDSSTSFIPGTVMINGVASPSSNIASGINLGTISPRAIVNVMFTVRVNSVPSGGLLHQAINYSYQFTSGIDNITNTATTNTIELIVQDGSISVSKSASQSTAIVNDTITYTIDITNIGTEIAQNVFFQDEIDASCSFVSGSVTVDGVSKPSYNPVTGFTLPNISVGASTQIILQCKINSLPQSSVVNNISYVTFSYIFNQYGYSRTKTIISNSTSIQVQYTDIVGQRCNDNNYPQVGDTVTYTLSLTNVGNVPATNVQVLEPVVSGASFVPGSVTVNGIVESSLNPFTGFTLVDPIGSKQTTVVTYQVLVNSLNTAGLIENIAQVPFKYSLTPGGTVIDKEQDSNKVDTVANYVCMNATKSVDKSYAVIGEKLYYKVLVSNSGNINATNTVFTDIIQPGASFVAGSVAINGISYLTYNPNLGFTINIVCPGDIVEVTFQAIVESVPTPNIINNQSSLGYSYKPDPNGVTLTSTIDSNIVQTIVNKSQYTITKSVDKTYAQVGDPLVYTTVIQNTGTVVLTNVKFADFIGSYLSFYPGTVYINGVSYPSFNPTEQFSISDIHPGDTVTVVFAASIIGNPPVGYIPNTSEVTLSYKLSPTSPVISKTEYSNEVKTYVPSAQLNIVKSVDKSYAVIGNTLKYSFTVTNTGNTAAINTVFTDVIQVEATYVSGSVKLNGISMPNYNPQAGFTLGRMEEGQVVTVEFDVIVNSLPDPNIIQNSATTSFAYYVDPNQQPVTKTSTSNTVTTTINQYSATLTKSVNKSYAVVGNILDYTVTATNTGTVTLTNVNFTDLIPIGATFVPGSVYIDGVNNPTANPNTGFAINNVLHHGSVVVTFKVEVTSVPTPPQIDNTANISFKYKLTPTSADIDGSLTSNTVTTNIREVAVLNVLTVNKAYATVGDTLSYTSVISNNSNMSIENTNFIDSVPSNTTFIPGTVKINGVPYTSYNPNIGFTLGIIPQATDITITYDVAVDTLPRSGYIQNTSNLDYQYKVSPTEPYITASAPSNTVTTNIKVGNLTIEKIANRTIVKLNNVINYSFIVSNTGNTTLTNISLTDIIQSESTFNTGSVYVNGVSKPTFNPNIGFSIDDIPIGEQATVSFEVTANSEPANNQLLNSANISYSYYVDPEQSPMTNTKTSNTTTVYVYDTILSADKIADKSVVKIGDTLNYTITLTNDTIVLAENLVFQDAIQSNLSFVADSVYINGVQKIGYDPNLGFTIDDIPGNETTTITFATTVISRPANNKITNFASVDYEYTMDQQTTQATINTNIVITTLSAGELTLQKFVDKQYATVLDNISYTVVVKNTGSVNATNISLQDIMPAATSFNLGTVVVNGVTQPTYNPANGFNLANLSPNQYHTVIFSIRVDSLPPSGLVQNSADATFTYQLTPQDTPVTKTETSNIVTTNIKLGNLESTKAVNKAYATIGNTLTYTVTINNTGNENCFNIFFIDTVQSNASFVSGSVKINGITYSGYNPNTGFYISDIAGNSSATVTFDVTVQTLPQNYIIYNYAVETYKYYVNPTEQPILKQSTTNTASTIINVGSLNVTKSTSKSYATIDDIITYTINILNNGNTVAKNINFRDVLPTGLTFVSGSVKIGGISYTALNPYTSFSLGNVISGDDVVVTFDAKVTSIPTPSLVGNTANITFAYTVDPNQSDIVTQVDSNTVNTQLNVGSISLNKSVDKAYATKGDILTYTVVVANTGDVRADNVLFTDDLPSNLTFNTSSVKINGTDYPDYNLGTGFVLGNLNPLETVTVSFKATVVQTPTQSSILNFALGTFDYKIDPNGQYQTKSTQSNTVSTILELPALTSTKTVNKIYATLQNIVSYSIVVKNEGNTTISNISFTDVLLEGAIFKSGTVVINGVSYPSYDPIVGFILPENLLSGNTSTIQFDATITTLPSPPQVTNYATSTGEYKIDPQGPTYTISATSNTVITNVNVGSLSNVKSVDKTYAKVNDTVTYTSTITNTGNINATNLLFTDTLQTDLGYVSGTVVINTVTYPALDPTVGFALPDLSPGQTVTVTFTAKINSLPSTGYVTNTSNTQFSYKVDPTGTATTTNKPSNTVTTNVVLGKITSVKSVDKQIATVGDELTYTITLTNIGNVIDTNVLFQDTPSTGVTFKAGSVKVNNVAQVSYNPIIGFSLDSIGIGNVVTVSFVVTVASVPQTNTVTNQSVTTFEYIVNPQESPYSDTSYSNTVTTNIAYGNLNVAKAVNKQYATIGDELTYTITVTNNGNIDATNVVFLDATPQNTSFILGSVTVNGVSYPTYNPAAGFNLNTMTPGQIITVVYKVQVTDLCITN